MPELPEVETVRRTLISLVLNKVIKNVKVYYENILQNVSKEEFEQKIQNQKINDIKRVGKYLIFILDDYSIISHLRMEGKYFLCEDLEKEAKGKHEHVIFFLEDNKTLRYHDTRKFGTMHLINSPNFDQIVKKAPICHLAPEPLSIAFTEDYLINTLKKQNKPLKTVLLDQSVISGLGNIYVDEVCFLAKLSPYTKANTVPETKVKDILHACNKVIEKAINLGGTTIKSFVASNHATGLFQNELLVHTKEICPVCNTSITKTFIGGRGTYFCKKCQNVKTLCVGITGGIATGKSTVLKAFNKQKINVISCDEIVHKLYQNTQVINKINKVFNLTGDKIDRKKLAQIVFNDKEKKEKLEAIIHPLVRKEIEKEKRLNEYLFVEIPLLFEAKMEDLFDKIICVTCDRNTQMQRLCLRDNLTKEEAEKRINLQLDLKIKEEKSDYIIDSNDNIDKQITYILKRLEIIDNN